MKTSVAYEEALDFLVSQSYIPDYVSIDEIEDESLIDSISEYVSIRDLFQVDDKKLLEDIRKEMKENFLMIDLHVN